MTSPCLKALDKLTRLATHGGMLHKNPYSYEEVIDALRVLEKAGLRSDHYVTGPGGVDEIRARRKKKRCSR